MNDKYFRFRESKSNFFVAKEEGKNGFVLYRDNTESWGTRVLTKWKLELSPAAVEDHRMRVYHIISAVSYLVENVVVNYFVPPHVLEDWAVENFEEEIENLFLWNRFYLAVFEPSENIPVLEKAS